MKKRKLLKKTILEELCKRVEYGVPLSKAMAKLGIDKDISRPSVKALLDIYTDYGKVYDEALFPDWLDQESDKAVQEQPNDWTYLGYFPLGEWRQERCSDL